MVSSEDYLLEMCSGRAAWTVVPDKVNEIDLQAVSAIIENEGWSCTLRNRLCYTFAGEDVNITLYPSGKLLIKTDNREIASQIAQHHVQVWLSEY
ncbi:MAG TPA: hypothetical protein D7I10_07595 [Candidatus Poseidoniales archaeon]|nr:hypothetical protein [Acidimicrobiaceae bacterium]DAC60727.1 MAG TPA: hypothetical protein D7I10_07595 [Candidatus Poseidoniales archaeon]